MIWGAGGLGMALAKELAARKSFERVVLVSRAKGIDVAGVQRLQADMLDEASIEALFKKVATIGVMSLVLVATGTLHEGERQPEKSLRQINRQDMADVLAVNAIGPALIAKYAMQHMPRGGPAVFAAISARVGSISDNRLGGWYSYRASKAALNMLLKTMSIEWRRRNASAICVGLHPGTVDTKLSKPFQRGVTPEKLFTLAHSAAALLDVVDHLGPDDSGKVFAYDGTELPA